MVYIVKYISTSTPRLTHVRSRMYGFDMPQQRHARNPTTEAAARSFVDIRLTCRRTYHNVERILMKPEVPPVKVSYAG